MKGVIFLLFVTLSTTVSAQTATKVYYVTFGSAHYRDNDPLPQAAYSASRMEELLKTYANAKGIKYISTPEAMLTKKIFFQQLDKVVAMINQDRPTTPLLIIYFCGHGYLDSLLGSQFLISGEFKKTLKTTAYNSIAENIHITDLLEWLILKPIQFLAKGMTFRSLFLLDCCRDPFVNDDYSPQTAIGFWGEPLYNELNRFIDVLAGPVTTMLKKAMGMIDPFVLATSQWAQATVSDYPRNDLLKGNFEDTKVGPICRRALVFLDKMKKQQKAGISLYQFIKGITDPTLDAASDVSTVASKKTPNEDCLFFGLR